jgi:hypothetical protein
MQHYHRANIQENCPTAKVNEIKVNTDTQMSLWGGLEGRARMS